MRFTTGLLLALLAGAPLTIGTAAPALADSADTTVVSQRVQTGWWESKTVGASLMCPAQYVVDKSVHATRGSIAGVRVHNEFDGFDAMKVENPRYQHDGNGSDIGVKLDLYNPDTWGRAQWSDVHLHCIHTNSQ
jgi:hypothetical protein